MKTNQNTLPVDYYPETATIRELEARQRVALTTVHLISRYAGGEFLPLRPVAEGTELHLEQPGIYILDHEVAAKGAIITASFEFDKKKLSGAADSAHAV